MGSVPEGTLCSYCGVREAGYIPDGAAGPICFEPDGKCCWDRVVALGWDVIVQERQMRLNTKSEYHYSSAICDYMCFTSRRLLRTVSHELELGTESLAKSPRLLQALSFCQAHLLRLARPLQV